MLVWQDLIQTVTRDRATGSETPRGSIVENWTGVPSQAIRATIQPYSPHSGRGVAEYQVEGAVQKVSNVLYCNFVISPAPNAPATDIQFLDRITDARGQKYRVLAALDDAGEGDHLKVLLTTLSPTGE